MKIRTRMLFIYGLMLLLLMITGLYSISSIKGWGAAADELGETYDQSIKAEKLRSNTQRQINFAYDFFAGDKEASEEFNEIQEQTELLIDQLKLNSHSSTETDLIESLEETQFELIWLTNRYFQLKRSDLSQATLTEARARFREIGDEVADDVAALSHYYDQLQSRMIEKASSAGEAMAWVFLATALLALTQFIALVALSQKWLVKPIEELNRATRSISGGNLDISIDQKGNNEWGELADSINLMARSLKESRQQLAVHERSAALGELAAYAAHNIRNPLAGIRAAAQVVANESTSLDEDTIESLKEIIESIDRLDSWLKRLLEYARPLEIQPEKVDINYAVKESVEIAGKQFSRNNTRIVWHLDGDIPQIEIDPILIEQAVSAIAANAFEAAGTNGEIIIETAMITGLENDDRVEIRISDNGRGVPESIRPDLFRAFMTSKDGGTGLGLAQAKKIIDLHGGEINLADRHRHGASFVVGLPVRKQAG